VYLYKKGVALHSAVSGCHVLYIEVLCGLLLAHLEVQALFTSSTKAPGTHSFTATSTVTYTLLPTGARGLLAHSCITFVQSVLS